METVGRDSKAWIEVYHLGGRRYPRCAIQLPIEYYQFKSSITRIADISEGGLLVYLPEEIDVGQYLRLKLYFSLGSELQTIRILAEVVWKGNHLTEDGEYYPYGVTFVDISSGDWAKLVNLIRNLSSPLDNLGYPSGDLKVRFARQEFTSHPGG
jgi:c-di-GMP-binding flagellar brake protein YcgR